MKKVLYILCVVLFSSTCTKVTDLSDKAELTAFNILSVTPPEIELGTPVMNKDTIEIPVLRGISLFPMSISASPEISQETEQAVPGTSFSSFDDIRFDLGDIQLNQFFLVAKSGQTRPYHIRLSILDQNEMNDFKKLTVTGYSPGNAMVAANAFINPIQRTAEIYATGANFPMEITAAATLSDHAYIKNGNNTLDKESLTFSFGNYGDYLPYIIEAENGAVQNWKIFLRQSKEVAGNETSDIRSAVSLNPAKQNAEMKTPGYSLTGIDVDEAQGRLVFSVSSLTGDLNVEILPKLATLTNSQILGYNPGESVLFDNYHTTKSFMILDSRTGYYRKWEFAVIRGDVADIHTFPFTYTDHSTNYIRINEQASVDNFSREITLIVTTYSAEADYWPVTVTPGNVILSGGASATFTPLTFNNINDIARFNITSSLGEETEWTVRLTQVKTDFKADIENVVVNESSAPSLTDSDISINTYTQDVFIDLKDRDNLPLRIQPYITLSEGAEFESFQNGDFMEFRTLSDTIKVNTISGAGEIKTWTIRLLDKAQLKNSDFELWVEGAVPNIDPIPGNGRGWATANNFMVKGTLPVTGTLGKAAEMTTGITALPKNLITSGSLFLGYFDMSTISLDQPRKMTKFGIPFEASPIAMAVDVKYTPGPKYQQSKHISGSGVSAQYELEDLNGQDHGQIWVELVHWKGTGNLDYSGEPKEGVHVLARGEHDLSATNGWIRLNIPIQRTDNYRKYTPTHLVVVMASSIEGHLFKGAKDSKLTVDNFELIY